jgi:Family of unknown function (DUF6340)
MQPNPIIPYFFLLLYLTAGGCYAEHLSLELLEPAKIVLPSDIQNVSVLRLPGTQSKKGTFDNLQQVKLDRSADPMKIKMGYVYGLFDVLTTSPRFKRVVLSPARDSSIISKERLYWDDLIKICTDDSTDCAIILTKAISEDYDNPYNFDDFVTTDYTLINKTNWIFYDPFNQTELLKFHSFDTIVITGGFAVSELKYFLYDACLSVGMQVGNKLVPHWRETDRIYFTGPGKELKDAAQFVAKNQWYKASLLWQDLIEGSNNTKASRAAFNTALAFEQSDNLDQASLWINFADSIALTNITKDYKKILDSRLKLKSVLDAQIAGN